MIDIQSTLDERNLPIERVGIKRLKRPLSIRSQNQIQHVVADFSMYVSLQASQRGTHMSRFIALVEDFQEPIEYHTLNQLAQLMCEKLHADEGEINIAFPYFIRKKAPISESSSLMDYEVELKVIYNTQNQTYQNFLGVSVPVTSLCPCSKEISNYGAHNQRSYIRVQCKINAPLSIEELVYTIEKQASCELYGVLKRPDEKHVTEHAYDNPKFVEDLVRDVANQLKEIQAINSFLVESENLESIHNHSAFARISSQSIRH